MIQLFQFFYYFKCFTPEVALYEWQKETPSKRQRVCQSIASLIVSFSRAIRSVFVSLFVPLKTDFFPLCLWLSFILKYIDVRT